MNNINEVIGKVQEARRQHRDSLTGIDRMHWNLLMRHRGWILREDGKRCVTVSEIAGRVKKYAPKSIAGSREELVKAVESLWAVTHDYSIASEDWMQEEPKSELEYIFN
jgi:hypothetical protein